MSLSIKQFRQNVKREFSTVVPMYATATERKRPRPQTIVCPGCNGTRRLEHVNPDTLEIDSMPCLFCNETGSQVRNASRVEHRSLVERLGAWSWAAVKAVLL